MSDGLPPPEHRTLGNHDAWIWTVTVHGVDYHVAWWVDTGDVFMSFQRSRDKWSRFVRLGPRYSPQPDLRSATAAIAKWARNLADEHA